MLAAVPFTAAPIPPPVVLDVPEDFPVAREDDYRFWRYSRAMLPFLLFILAVFIVVTLLTMYQSHSDIRRLKAGIPRDLVLADDDDAVIAGHKNYKRNMRIALIVTALFFGSVALCVFAMPLKPLARSRINYVVAVLLFLVSILAVVTFALDVDTHRNGRSCTVVPNESVVCKSFEGHYIALVVFVAAVAVLSFLAALMIACYSKSGDWTKANDFREAALYGATDPAAAGYLPGMYPNGVSFVRKTLTLLTLFALLAFTILVLLMTIYMVEQDDVDNFYDEFGRPQLPRVLLPDETDDDVNAFGDDETRPFLETANRGWPIENSAVRYAACALVIVTVLLNLIPLQSRVVAYVFGFLYFTYLFVIFTAFGLDVSALNTADDVACPDGYECKQDGYAATAAIEFIGGVAVLLYIIVEYFVMHRKRTNPAP